MTPEEQTRANFLRAEILRKKIATLKGQTAANEGQAPVEISGVTSAGKDFSYPKQDLERKILPQFFTGLRENQLIDRMAQDLPENLTQLPIAPENMPEPKGLLAGIARAVGNIAPDLAASAPYMKAAGLIKFPGALSKLQGILRAGTGYGAYEGVKAAVHGEKPGQIAKQAAQGAGSAMAFNAAGRVGASMIPKRIPGAERIGSALGAGAVGALGDEMSGNDTKSGMVLGAGLGFLHPSKRISPNFAEQAVREYRSMLKPEKGEHKKFEVVRGQDLNDFYKLAVEERLPIKSVKDAEKNRLDTGDAVDTVLKQVKGAKKELDLRLKRAKPVMFDLDKVRITTKKAIEKQFDNAEELNKANAIVDKFVDAEIQRRGNMVDGFTLNEIKSGLQSIGYDAQNPLNNQVARRMSFVVKKLVNKNYNYADIPKINDYIAERMSLIVSRSAFMSLALS